jgi:hypothetical protein
MSSEETATVSFQVLDTGSAERGHGQVARCLIAVRHENWSRHSQRFSLSSWPVNETES